LFSAFRLLPTARLLLKDGSPVHLGDRALDILIALVEHAGQVDSAGELRTIVWPKMCIDQSALRVHILALRRALGHAETETRFIVNVHGRGYAFVAETQRVSERENLPGSRAA
jgi:DNA-binding winged helix-turn-helix (wHTH) protein